MSVGSKIRYIRNLEKLTQKELGLKAGFSSAAADVRIRQYESDKMTPKAAILKKIAEALDVDTSALSEVEFRSQDELLHTLFDLERDYGLRIEKQNSKYVLSFDEENPYGASLKPGLDAWYRKRQKMLSDLIFESERATQIEHDYQLWTQRYPLDLKRDEAKQQEKLLALCEDRCVQLKQQEFGMEKINELLPLFEKLDKCGIEMEISSDTLQNSVGKLVARVTLRHSQCLDLIDSQAVDALAEFLCTVDFLREAGFEIEIRTHSLDGETYVDYYFHNSVLATLLINVIKELQDESMEEEERKYKYKDAMRLFHVNLNTL